MYTYRSLMAIAFYRHLHATVMRHAKLIEITKCIIRIIQVTGIELAHKYIITNTDRRLVKKKK